MLEERIGKYETIATVVAVVIVGFYATGMYRNLLEIKKLHNEKTLKNGQKSS